MLDSKKRETLNQKCTTKHANVFWKLSISTREKSQKSSLILSIKKSKIKIWYLKYQKGSDQDHWIFCVK